MGPYLKTYLTVVLSNDDIPIRGMKSLSANLTRLQAIVHPASTDTPHSLSSVGDRSKAIKGLGTSRLEEYS